MNVGNRSRVRKEEETRFRGFGGQKYALIIVYDL